MRPSPWVTTEAKRTYVSGVLWGAGLLAWVSAWTLPGWSDWFQPAAMLFMASSLAGGLEFFPKGVRSAATLKLDMNFLMTVAILGAVIIGEPLEAAAIAFLFSLAELLEHSAVVRSRDSIDQLLRLSPDQATLVGPDGGERSVPTSELRMGDKVRIRPGEKVPIDGVVRVGRSAVNQANVTGESLPVAKGPGDGVFASSLNTDGFIEVEATTDAGDTTLDRIARMVREAQSQRSPTEQFVKTFARYYTPAVTGLAVFVMLVPPLLGMGTHAEWFVRGLTLLVIACPCALVIATPVTIMSALTAAARHGVLIKGGEYVEALGATTAMAFDKTGTLTSGRLSVTDVLSFRGWGEEALLQWAATVEGGSEHPIAKAIVRYAGGGNSGVLEDFRAHSGMGVSGKVDGVPVVVGTVELLHEAGIGQLEESDVARFESLEREGKTVVVAASQGRVAGMIALADTIRPEAGTVLAQLRIDGVRHQVLLTGDQPYAAQAVGAVAGVDEIHSALKPEEKVVVLRRVAADHGVVAMIGDGVNDAPALAAASVGIAMGGAGSPATIETADIVLMADDLAMLPYARRVSKLARSLVRWNIGFALVAKGVLATGAVMGSVSLLVAVLVGDLGASLAVTLNAMRIARMKP